MYLMLKILSNIININHIFMVLSELRFLKILHVQRMHLTKNVSDDILYLRKQFVFLRKLYYRYLSLCAELIPSIRNTFHFLFFLFLLAFVTILYD